MNIDGDWLVSLFEEMRSVKQKIKPTYDEVSQLCLPNKYRSTEVNKTELPVTYDNIGSYCVSTLSSAIYSYLINPATKWFDFQPTRENEPIAIQRITENLAKVQMDILNKSNYYQASSELLWDYSAYGTACMYYTTNPITGIPYFRAVPVDELYILENQYGIVDTVVRHFTLTVKQAIEKFKNPGETAKQKYEQGKLIESIEYLHIVLPRTIFKGKETKFDYPYAEYYVAYEKKEIIEESGYKRFPFAVARFYKLAGIPYGASPAVNNIDLIRAANCLSRDILEALELAVAPPYEVINVFAGGKISLASNEFIMRDPHILDPNVPAIRPILTNPTQGIATGVSYAQYLIERIKEAFFLNAFLFNVDVERMTATEIIERKMEKMALLAPPISRLIEEFLQPVITGVYEMLIENNVFQNEGIDLLPEAVKIEYLSPLAKAQKASEDKNLVMFTNFMLQLAGADPTVMDTVNTDKLVRKYADMQSVPPSVLRSEDEAEALRQQRQQQMAELQQAETLARLGKAGLVKNEDIKRAEQEQAEQQYAEALTGITG